MKVIWAALLDTFKAIDFASILSGVLTAFGGIWGKLASFVLKPIVTSVEKSVDDQITRYENAQKSDDAIDQAAQTHTDQIQKATTDEEIDKAFRDNLS